MKHKNVRRFLALLLAAVMTVSLSGIQALAAEDDEAQHGVTWEELDPSQVSAELLGQNGAIERPEELPYAETDMVRALIIFEEQNTLSSSDLRAVRYDPLVRQYCEIMRADQAVVAASISRQALDGETLDVIWSFDIVANAVSVNVAYGKLDEIANTRGVKRVLLERSYELPAQPSNVTGQQMTGADGVKSGAAGYYGAGTQIAIIDTGLTVEHISFDPDAFAYALAEDAAAAGVDYDAYVKGLGLITKDTIAANLQKLHAYERNNALTADDLYQNMKVPFAFNYATGEADVSHYPGDGNEHGSHVAGIAAANRYLPASQVYDMDGDADFDTDDAQRLLDMVIRGEKVTHPLYTDVNNDGKLTAYDAYLLLRQVRENGAEAYVPAAGSVRVDGVAPDAQIVAMKVFGASGTTYSSDYIAALEDAITLGVDVSNLSLGSPQPGFSSAHNEVQRSDPTGALIDEWINAIFDKAVESGMVVSISAGNSGNWADYDDAYQLMYADEGGVGNLGAPGSFAGAFTVASADNTGSTVSLTTEAFNDAGETLSLAPYDLTGTPAPWETMDPDSFGSEYEFVFLGDPTNLLTGQPQTDETIYAGNKSDFDGVDFTGKIAVVARGNMVNFIDKHQNAEAAGAAAIIIYNNEPGDMYGTVAGTEASGDTPATPPTTARIPVVSISLDEAKALFALADTSAGGNRTGTIAVTYRLILKAPAPDSAPQMSYFSSWGTTGGLTIKPEITAPGGDIMSVNGMNGSTDEYELMSGTSMSSPHNAGLTALGVEYVTAHNNEVLGKARAFDSGLTAGALVQSLLMSTAEPLMENGGVEYSVRNQGAGLANIKNAVDAQSFLLIDGMAGGKVKAELGDTSDKDSFSFTFTVNNLTDSELVYDLSDSILTTGVTTVESHALATDEMVRLDADVTYAGADGGKVTVPANGAARVTVEIRIPESAAAARKDLGFTNGFYVEGFIYLKGEGLVTHSIPLLGWYGDWCDPSMYDVNSIIDLFYGSQTRPSHIDASSKNELTYAPIGANEGYPFTGNLYNMNYGVGLSEDAYIEARNAINTADPAWNFYAVFPTLIRAARDFGVYITDADSGKVYYEDHIYDNFERALGPSFFQVTSGQWYDVTSAYGMGIEWDLTDPATGAPLPEGTRIRVSFVAVPEYGAEEPVYDEEGNETYRPDLKRYLDKKGTTLSWTFTVDNTDPEVVRNVVDGVDKTFQLLPGDKLSLQVKDNRHVAAVVVLNGSASEAVAYYYPNMTELGETKTMELDLSNFRKEYGEKAVIAVADYAGNESYYAVNLNGAGAPYGAFVGFQFDGWGGSKWVAFDPDVERNETSLFVCDVELAAAEYVNGMVFAQGVDGKLYGIPYEDMLAESVDLEKSLITQLDTVYQDFAYSYADRVLYGMYAISDQYTAGETHFDAIYLEDALDDWGYGTSAYEVEEEAITARTGLFGMTIACDDSGAVYVLGSTDVSSEPDVEEMSDTAHLWKFTSEDTWYGKSWSGSDMGDTGLTLDYRQSAAWNHNDETLYWARFVPSGVLSVTAELYTVDPTNGTCKRTGTLTSETAGLFAPLGEEAAEKDVHQNVPAFNREEVAAPILSSTTLTMNVGATAQLTCTFSPWYSNYKDVTWSSEDEEVASVDANGLVTAKAAGNTVITVTSAKDPSLTAQCQVSVASLTLSLEGYVSTSAGLGIVSDVNRYTFKMTDGVAAFSKLNAIRPGEGVTVYGMSLASSVKGKDGKIWACEWANTGMMNQLNEDGVIEAVDEPIDGDVMYGLGYSQELDRYIGVMNGWLYVDLTLPVPEADRQEMMDSYDQEENQYNWHRVDMRPFLSASQGNLVTPDGESGNMSVITFAAITNVPSSGRPVEFNGSAFGGYESGGSYVADTTWVLLDNVGRLWYIDEVAGMRVTSEYGESFYTNAGGSMLPTESSCIFAQDYTAEDGGKTYNVFVIRELVETPLYDIFRSEGLGITYYFNDLHYVQDIDGNPMYLISLYRYWDSAEANDLYLYVQNREPTGEYDSNWQQIYTKGSLYNLGSLDRSLVVATIYDAKYESGLVETTIPVRLDPGALPNSRAVTVCYDKDSGMITLPTAMDIYYQTGWNIPDNLTLVGWTDSEGAPVTGPVALEKGLVFTAQWREKISVTYKPGDELVGAGEVSVAYDGTTFDLPIQQWELENFGWYIPENLEFAGWKDSSGTLVEDYEDLPLTEGLVYTAVWKQLTAVTFHPGEEGSALGFKDAVKYFSEETFELPTRYDFYSFNWRPIPENYTFAGWKDSSGNPVESTEGIEFKEGLEFTAIWNVRPLSTDTSIASVTYNYLDTSTYTITKYPAVKGEDDNWTLEVPAGLTIPDENQLFRIIVETTDPNATGEATSVEDGVYTLTVTAEDSSVTKTYTLTITHKAE